MCRISIGTIVTVIKYAAEVGQHLRQMRIEASRGGPVDDSMVPGQRQRKNQPRRELLAVHTGRVAVRQTPRIATSGALMIGVK